MSLLPGVPAGITDGHAAAGHLPVGGTAANYGRDAAPEYGRNAAVESGRNAAAGIWYRYDAILPDAGLSADALAGDGK